MNKKCGYINDNCPDNCYGNSCNSNNKCINKICKCNRIRRKAENQRYVDQDCLSILSKDYNSIKYIKNPNYLNVYSFNKNCLCNKKVQNNKYKIVNYDKVRKLYSTQYRKPSDALQGHRKQYYNKIYNKIYPSMRSNVISLLNKGKMSKKDIKTAEYIAHRKTLGWIRTYANTQGTTNDGWPAIPLNGTSY